VTNRNLVSVAGCRRAACGSVSTVRRLGRHHHRLVFALPVAWLATDAKTRHLNVIAAWDLFGAADLLLAITLGVTAAEGSPLQIFHAAPGSAAMQQLPWSFVPTVLVPFWLILHAIIWAQSFVAYEAWAPVEVIPILNLIELSSGRTFVPRPWPCRVRPDMGGAHVRFDLDAFMLRGPRTGHRWFWRDRDRRKPIVASLLAVGLHLLPCSGKRPRAQPQT